MMREVDQNYLNDIKRMDPDYQFAKSWMAAAGYDMEAGEATDPKPFELDESVQRDLGFRIAKPGMGTSSQYAEPAGPPSPFNEHGQPGAQLGGYRKVANWYARKLANVTSFVPGLISDKAGQLAYDATEATVRSVATQAVPALAQFVTRTVQFVADTDTYIAAAEDVMNQVLGLDTTNLDAARELHRQATGRPEMEQSVDTALEAYGSDGDKNVGEVLQGGVDAVFNPPQSSAENIAREALTVLAGFKAFKGLNQPVQAGKEVGRAGQMVQTALRGSAADAVVVDPNSDTMLDAVFGFVAPSLRDVYQNYITSGGSKEADDLRKSLTSRLGNAGFGMAGGAVVDGFFAVARQMRVMKVADHWRDVKEASGGLDIGDMSANNDLLIQVDTLLDDLARAMGDDPDAAAKNLADPRMSPAARASIEADQARAASADSGLRMETDGLTDGMAQRLQQFPSVLSHFEQLKAAPLEEKVKALDEMLGGVGDVSARQAEAAPAGAVTDEAATSTLDEAQAKVEEQRTLLSDENHQANIQTLGIDRANEVREEGRKNLAAAQAELYHAQKSSQVTDDLADSRPVSAESSQRMEAERVAVSDVTSPAYAEEALASNRPPDMIAAEVATALTSPKSGSSPQEWGTVSLPGSKVVSETGELIPVFHGTGKVYPKASDEALGSGAGMNHYGKGHYHTEDPGLSGEYAEMGGVSEANRPNIRKVYLDLKNPLDMEAPLSDEAVAAIQQSEHGFLLEEGMLGDEFFQRLVEGFEQAGSKAFDARELARQELEKLGFDGIKYAFNPRAGDEGAPVWMAFHAEQLHTAFDIDAAVEQLMAATSPAPAKGARRTGMQAAKEGVEGLEAGTTDMPTVLTDVMQTGKLNREKATKLILKMAKAKENPTVLAIMNDPTVKSILGAATPVIAIWWGATNLPELQDRSN